MVPAIPAAGAGLSGTPGASNGRGRKTTPSPSRGRDLPTAATTRPPLFPTTEKDNNNSASNAAVHRRPRGKEIPSRYVSSSSPPIKSVSLASPSSSTGSSSSKSGSVTTTSRSTMSSSSSATYSTSVRRFPSQISTPRPLTPPTLPQNSVPKRSKSVDRTRAVAAGVAAPRVAELASAARTLCTTPSTTRSLSVSFQGESFSYQTSKTRPASPSPNRRPTPDRRKPVPSPAVTPTRSIVRPESSRTFDSHHRWPAARASKPNPLAKSLDCSLGNNYSILTTVRQSMVFDDGASASFDLSDLSASSCTGSPSSESSVISTKVQATSRGITARFSKEKSGRLHSSPEAIIPLALGSKSMSSSRLDPARKSLDNNSLLSLSMAPSPRYVRPSSPSVRPSSPSRLAANSSRGFISPQRSRNSPMTSNSRESQSSCGYSVADFSAKVKRGKNGENRIEDAHQLRLFYNRLLQWRWANAQASDALFVQELISEKHLYNAWITAAKIHESLTTKNLKLLMERHYLKLSAVLKGQMAYLEEWTLIERDHANSLEGIIDALETSTFCLPVGEGAKADFQELRNAVVSAMDVMQAIGTSICSIFSKVERRRSMVTELMKLANQEQIMMHHCRDLLSTVAAMHVKQCSLLGHVAQLQSRPSLIQL